MSGVGDINGWQCKGTKTDLDKGGCGSVTYAIHVDEGVTPMFLACRATEGCRGMAVSLMYPDPPAPRSVLEAVAWEWFKPDAAALRKLRRKNPALAEHVDMGGLDIRELTDAGRVVLKQYHGYES